MLFRRWLLWTVLLVSLVAAGVILSRRYAAEAADRRVAVVMSLNSFRRLAAESPGIPPSRLLAELRQSGLTGLLWEPETLRDMAGDGELRYEGASAFRLDLLAGRGGASLRPDLRRLPPGGSVLLLPSPSTFRRVSTALRLEYGDVAREVLLENGPRLWVLGTALPPATLGGVLVRPLFGGPYLGSRPGVPAHFARATLEYLAGPSHPAFYLFSGSSVPGYPETLSAWKHLVGRADLGSIEFYPQAGLAPLARKLGYPVVRAYSVSASALSSPVETLSEVTAEVENRRIRVVVVHPAEPADTLAARPSTEAFLRALRASLMRRGFLFGRPQPLRPFPADGWYLRLTGLGAAAAVGLLLDPPLASAAAFILLAAGAILLGHLSGERRLYALLAGLALPTLGLLAFAREKRRDFPASFFGFLRVSLLSLAGGLLVTALLSFPLYLSGLGLFLGTKLLFVLPPLLFLVFLFRREGISLRRAAEMPLRLSHLLWAALAVLVGLVYLTRSGNHSLIAVSPWELAMRRELRELLPVRPRTKEFLIGHPAFILGGYLRDRLPALAISLLTLGAVGQVDIVDTFAHLVSPLRSDLWRSLLGLLLGIPIGLFLAAVAAALWRAGGGRKGE